MTQKQFNYDTVLYHVKSGDTLDNIIKRYFGKVTAQQRTTILYSIQKNNQKLKNPDKIYPNEIIQIEVPPQRTTTPVVTMTKSQVKALQKQLQASTPKERSTLSTLTPLLFGVGSVATGTLNKIMRSNTPLLTEMVQNYENYKAGSFKKGAYDYQRQKLVKKFKTRMGPLKRILTRTKSTSELLTISRRAGVAPVKNITQTINNMGKMAKYASRGNVLLTGVSLGLACHDIANTSNVQKKNEILVETLGGIFTGVGAGILLLMAFTPVGWVALLVVGVATATISYGAGKVSKSLYNTYGQKIDIATLAGVSQLCSK